MLIFDIFLAKIVIKLLILTQKSDIMFDVTTVQK
jgi:hypothetical protein